VSLFPLFRWIAVDDQVVSKQTRRQAVARAQCTLVGSTRGNSVDAVGAGIIFGSADEMLQHAWSIPACSTLLLTDYQPSHPAITSGNNL
jgi:hypothetical protein